MLQIGNPGTIETAFRIVCADCKDSYDKIDFEEDFKLSDFTDYLKASLWHNVKGKGWICAECNRKRFYNR
jgi:hypothetical protein